MRAALLVAAVAAVVASAASIRSAANISEAARLSTCFGYQEIPCRPFFYQYKGWCVASTDPTEYGYNGAAAYCASVGAYAPSIHSQSDYDFWSNAVHTITPCFAKFWLDAYCPKSYTPYVWKDGTPTDYMGPKGELQSCWADHGVWMQKDGFRIQEIPQTAPAVCVYPANQNVETTTKNGNTDYIQTSLPTTVGPETTPKSIDTTTEPETTPQKIDVTTEHETTPKSMDITTGAETTPKSINVTDDYCTCKPDSIYLDIVFVVDTSSDMTSKTVGDATATIQSTLLGLTHGTAYYQSNVAVVAYGDKVQTVTNFGGFRSEMDIFNFQLPYLGGKTTKMTDAILQATSMISTNEREFTRGVIVLMSKSFNQLDSTNIRQASDAFQDDGGIFITIDYSKGAGIKGLKDIASPGYYINDASSRQDALNADMLYAFCDANCFCPDGLYPYNVPNENTGREVPRGCFHVADVAAVYNAAEQNCLKQKGFVATVHDDDKNFFMISIFPVKARYWIGLKRNGNDFEWADGSNEPFAYWAPGNPVAGQDCVYGQQQTGFKSLGFSAPCTDPLKNSMTYACQLRPCGSEYDCWA